MIPFRLAACFVIHGAITLALAERVILKDGFELIGEVQTADGQINVRTPLQWYTFASDQLLRTEPQTPATVAAEVYLLPKQARKPGRRIDAIASTAVIEPFDSFGRRRVRLRTIEGKERDVIQVVTEIHPTHLVVEALTVEWNAPIAIVEVTDEELIGMLDRQATANNLEDGIKLTQFLIQAKRYQLAQSKLSTLRTRFPDANSRIDLLQQNATLAIEADAQAAFERMMNAGRMEPASQIVREMLRLEGTKDKSSWQKHQDRLDRLLHDTNQIKQIVQQAIDDTSLLNNLEKKLASEILHSIAPSNLDRFAPLLVLTDQAEQTSSTRWSLAASGWIAGAKLAQTNQDLTRKWLADRDRIERVWLAKSDEDLERSIDDVRAAKVSPDLVAQLLRHLSAPPTELEPGQLSTIIPEGNLSATIEPIPTLLPANYSSAGSHPLLVALHDTDSTPEQAIAFWQEAATNLNAILVAPRYLLDPKRPYSYSLEEHQRMLATLQYLRRNLAVDPARVFLLGHGIGAFAAFDMGWSHPDQFAGIIPIGGAPLFYMQYYWRNVAHLPTYIVDGQWAGKNPAITRSLVQQNWKKGDPVISTIYVGRGPGRFGVEVPKIMDWIARQRRPAFPLPVQATSARHGDTRFYWMQIESFLPKSTIAPTLFDQKKSLRPAKIEGKLELGRSLSITSSGIDGLKLLLSPLLLPLADPHLEIRYQGKVVHTGPIESDIETMLREAHHTGDRDRLIHHILTLR